MPDAIKRLTDEGHRMNVRSGWRYKLHRDEILDRYAADPYIRRLNGMSEKTAFIVDRLRLLLLRDEGGWWFDSDCRWIKPASALNRICDSNADFVTGIRNPWRPHVHPVRGVALVDNTVMGSVKGGRMVKQLLGLYTAEQPKQTGQSVGAYVLANADESTVLLNFRYFYADESKLYPESIVSHDSTNAGTWARPPEIPSVAEFAAKP